jgi:hypothetical protein
MANDRTTYLLMVRAEPGVDSVHALRAWLKMGLRTFGLKCVGITPREEEEAMDMREFAGSKYIKPDQVRDGPIQTRVVNVFKSEQHGRPVLELEDGSQFTLNDSNNNALMKAWGYNSDDWIGQEIELFLGTYKNWRTDPPSDAETVKVKAVSPAKTAQNGGMAVSKPPLPPSRTAAAAAARKDDLDDSIPF